MYGHQQERQETETNRDRTRRRRRGGGETRAELGDERRDGGVTRPGDKHLGRGDDGADAVQVDDDGAVPGHDAGRVRQRRVQRAEVARRQPRPPHQLVLPDGLRPPLARGRQRRPLPRRGARRRVPPPRWRGRGRGHGGRLDLPGAGGIRDGVPVAQELLVRCPVARLAGGGSMRGSGHTGEAAREQEVKDDGGTTVRVNGSLCPVTGLRPLFG